MQAAADRLDFAPPPPPGLGRALVVALLAHALLLAALAWGTDWRREAQIVTAEAELWAQLPQAAAPRLQEVRPEPPPAVQPPQAQTTPRQNVDIATERARLAQQEQQREKDKQLQAQQARQRAAQAQREREQAARNAQRDEKRETQRTQAALEAQRQEQMRRIAGLAGASGPAGATGQAMQAAGPSASYAGRLRARIRPNIVFTEDLPGNPVAEVEVRTAPDGTIVGRRLLKSSGDKGWDDAVMRAIDRTEVLPRDSDGRVPASLVISFRPRD